MFTSGGEMAWKLMDLQNFAVYFDLELLGSLEGQGLIVSLCVGMLGSSCGWGKGEGLIWAS